MKEIYFKEDNQSLYDGISKLEKAVASTLGPNGKTVIITDEHGNPYITKDGVSVARAISFKNPLENIGASLVKEVCELQVKQAGDGTTTAIVLANAFIQNLKEFNSNDINKAFDEIIPKVIEQLKTNSKELKHEDIKYVATISANNDNKIGDIIQKAYDHTNIVKVEESKNLEDTLELVNGMSLSVSYFSKHFINNHKKGTCEFNNNVFVLLLNNKLEKLENFQSQLEQAQIADCSLLIVAEEVNEQSLRKLESLVLSMNLPVCVIKTPGFAKHRKDLLEDLSKFTGATIINDCNRKYSNTILGRLDSCKITKNNSILIKHDDLDITDLISNLKDQCNTDLPQHDIDLLKQRIEYLEGKVSIIKVGGGSELEVKERFDRYDDAVKATASALEEGIVEGGGIAFQRILFSDQFYLSELNVKNLNDAVLISLLEPLNRIRKNGAVINENVPSGMFKQNIIDPLKVTRCALENAVSIAKTILSTDTIVLNENQWN